MPHSVDGWLLERARHLVDRCRVERWQSGGRRPRLADAIESGDDGVEFTGAERSRTVAAKGSPGVLKYLLRFEKRLGIARGQAKQYEPGRGGVESDARPTCAVDEGTAAGGE